MEYLTTSTIHNNSEKVSLSDNVIKEISKITEKGQILSVYSSNARAIYFFPVNSKVYRISIQIYPLTPEIVARIMTKISEFARKVIYSTGLCLIESRCFWEGYLAEKDLSVDFDKIKEILNSVPEVKEVEISPVEIVDK